MKIKSDNLTWLNLQATWRLWCDPRSRRGPTDEAEQSEKIKIAFLNRLLLDASRIL